MNLNCKELKIIIDYPIKVNILSFRFRRVYVLNHSSAQRYLVAAPNENPPPVPVDPRVLEPKLKPDILDLNSRNLTIRTKAGPTSWRP